MTLDQLKNFFVRNWREKLIALLLAFLFWFMIKSQVHQDDRPLQPPQQPLPQLRAA